MGGLVRAIHLIAQVKMDSVVESFRFGVDGNLSASTSLIDVDDRDKAQS